MLLKLLNSWITCVRLDHILVFNISCKVIEEELQQLTNWLFINVSYITSILMAYNLMGLTNLVLVVSLFNGFMSPTTQYITFPDGSLRKSQVFKETLSINALHASVYIYIW